jgi:MSHA biogenesis protein MshI
MFNLKNIFGKNKKPEGVVGLYITQDGIAYAHLVCDENDHPHLHPCQFISTGDLDAQKMALKMLVDSYACVGVDCIAVPSSEFINIVHIERPEVDDKDLVGAIRWQLRDHIDYDPQDAIIDYFNMPGQSHEISRSIYAVAANYETIESQATIIKAAGLKLKKIDITELALKNFAMQISDSENGIAIVHFFGKTGLLQIIHQQTLFLTRQINIGLDSFHFSAEEFDIDVQKTRMMDRLVLEIQRSLDFYESHFKKPHVKNIAIPPLEETVPELAKYVSTELAINAWSINIKDLFSCAKKIDESLESVCTLAIGAALSGLGQ